MRLLSRIKGRLMIELPERAYHSGDFVSGALRIRTRRPVLDGDLTLVLRCDQTVQSWDGQRRQQFETNELFTWTVLNQTAVDIDGEVALPFMFQLPRSHDGHAVDSMPGWSQAAALILKAMDSWESTIQWSLVAHLCIDGLDLSDTCRPAFFVS